MKSQSVWIQIPYPEMRALLNSLAKTMSQMEVYAMETKIEINDNFLEMEIFQFFCCVQGHHPPLKTRGLSRQLKALEEDGLIIRTEYAKIPPKVEYSLSNIGMKVY